MTTKKLPISLNDEEQAAIARLASLLGWTGIYGEEAKTLKFGITYALASIEGHEKLIPRLEGAELDAFFQTVRNCRKSREASERLLEARKEVEKYNPSVPKSIGASIPKADQPVVSEMKRA